MYIHILHNHLTGCRMWVCITQTAKFNPLFHFAPAVPQRQSATVWNTEDLWSWLELRPSNADAAHPRSSCPPGTVSGLRVRVKQWVAQPVIFWADFCSIIWDESSRALYCTQETKETPSHYQKFLPVKNTSLFSWILTGTDLLFATHHEFPLEPYFTLCRHTACIKLTLRCYLKGGGANKASMLGFLRTRCCILCCCINIT